MEIGLEIGDFTWDGGPGGAAEVLADFARTADDGGVELLAVPDHLWQGPHQGGPEGAQLECFTTLATIAAHTSRCRLMPGVTAVHFRNPALLAKTITTIDVLSGGRAWLGIGVGWDESEAIGLGLPFPPLADRFAMLEETLQVCLRMWTGEHGDDSAYTGEHYRLGRALNLPQSLTRPHPPILIGGNGPRRTLKLVARYADACNLAPDGNLPAVLDTLRWHCEAEGRDFASITKTTMQPFELDGNSSSAEALLTDLRLQHEQGIDMAMGIVTGPRPVEVAEIVANKIVPEVRSW